VSPKVCDRCKSPMSAYSMSYFNTEEICFECVEKERAHPAFERARDAELKACQGGNFNFPGIGLPADLRPAR
jgi:hypothetical protein